MGNTGTRIVLTLRERNLTTNTLTGRTKPNVPGDPDYIPPQTDLDSCPVDLDYECPVVTAGSPSAGQLFFEYSLPASAVANPAIASVRTLIYSSVPALVSTTIHPAPFSPNYMAAFIGLAAGTYTINVAYYNSGNVLLHTCTTVATVIVT